MKKLVKVLVVLLAFFSQLPFAAAQDAAPSFVDLMTQANEAALKLETFHLESSLSVIGTTKTTPRSLTANLTGDVDVKNAELQGSLDLQLPPTTNGQFEAVVKGAKAFFREGDNDWHVSDVSVNKQEFQKAYAKFLEVAKTNSELDKEFNTALSELFNVEAKDDEYQLSLKQNIDGAKFYQDHEALFKKLQQAALDQAKQAGQNVSEDSFSKVFTADNFKKFFELNPSLVVSYDKETHFVKAFNLVLHVDVAQVNPKLAEGDDAPQTVDVTFSVTVSNHNQPVDIKEPEAGAGNANSASSSEE